MTSTTWSIQNSLLTRSCTLKLGTLGLRVLTLWLADGTPSTTAQSRGYASGASGEGGLGGREGGIREVQLLWKSGVPPGIRRDARILSHEAVLGLPQCWWIGCMGTTGLHSVVRGAGQGVSVMQRMQRLGTTGHHRGGGGEEREKGVSAMQ